MADGQTYEAAGVSLATAERARRAPARGSRVDRRDRLRGLCRAPSRSTTSACSPRRPTRVGTKLIVARERGALRNCGADLAAHCINDVITSGADPLLLLDYVAANRDRPRAGRGARRRRGGGVPRRRLRARRRRDRRAPGRSTATASSTSPAPASASSSATGSWTARTSRPATRRRLPSAGVHANGFTLVRQILEQDDYDGDDLLAPTRLYLDDVRRLREQAHAFAHVTGGGIAGNLARVVPGRPARGDRLGRVGAAAGLRVAWRVTSRRRSCGASSTSASASAPSSRDAGRAISVIGRIEPRMIGVLVSGEGTNLQALIDAGLPIVAVASNRPGRARARASRAPRTSRPRSSSSTDYARREERDVALADVARGARRRARRLRRLHAPLPRAVPRPLPAAASSTCTPSPLPEFPGAHPIEDVLAAGVAETAATVHYVDEGIDTGPVIAAERVPV